MGEVVATIKLMPENPDVDLNKIKTEIENSIPESTELHKIDEEPVAFGLVALIVTVIVGDAEGGTEEVEANLAKLEDIGNIEVTDIRRLM
ncbi:MAG: elongation factor 1-beta [Methanobacteriaceae archaeon]|jgi:elongation factor 1-beta|nr:MAG: elongation factor 1-beta [Methanobacterium sp. BRmetb2]MCC7557089.1 elongation factor 1-beta [Methanobacteriaceae archaeon]